MNWRKIKNNSYICIDNNYHFSLSKGGKKFQRDLKKKKNIV